MVKEGLLFEGGVSVSGEAGPFHRWIAVAPNGKLHLHSIDDPEALHCLGLGALQRGLEEGRMRLTGYAPEHPAIRLQRAKEARRIRDAHLGGPSELLERMFRLLEEAVAEGMDYAPFAAGEIREMLNKLPGDPAGLEAARSRIDAVMDNSAVAPPPR